MKYAIDELEGQLSSMIDQFCWSAEQGDAESAARASAIADDLAQALDVLKTAAGINKLMPQRQAQSV